MKNKEEMKRKLIAAVDVKGVIKMNILIEAPFNLGLGEPTPGIQPGTRFLPDALQKHNFAERLNINDRIRIDAPEYVSAFDAASGVRNAKEVAAYSHLLADNIVLQLKEHRSPLVIGGDCSILIGIMAGLKKAGRYGLFFIDGHTDFIESPQSSTAAAAGMELAIVAGLGHDSLTNIDGLKPYVKQEDVFCYGNREYDEAYEAPVINSRESYYHLNKIRQAGINNITREYLQMAGIAKLDGFWIHLDADVLDDAVMPCVDSRTSGGLSYNELKQTLIPLINSPKFVGMSITIADPTMDVDGQVVKMFADEMITCSLILIKTINERSEKYDQKGNGLNIFQRRNKARRLVRP
jgi:arginase